MKGNSFSDTFCIYLRFSVSILKIMRKIKVLAVDKMWKTWYNIKCIISFMYNAES